jgi:hypothetical protein
LAAVLRGTEGPFKGSFLFNNYKQALTIIAEYTPQVELFKSQFQITDKDFEQWRRDEFSYLTQLSKDPEHDVLAVSYVEALQSLSAAE